jgi:hypothetical protein
MKTAEQLQEQIDRRAELDAERAKSDACYARKEFEKALIWVASIFGAAIIMAIARVIIK